MNGEISVRQLHLIGHRHRRRVAVERPGAPVTGNRQRHFAIHGHHRRVSAESRVMAQVFDPLEQRLAPQQIQQFPFATSQQRAVLEHLGLQLIGRLRQRRGIADAQDRQTMGQLPRHRRFVVRQLAIFQHVLRLIVAALQQLDDCLNSCGSNSLMSFIQAISMRVNKP